MPMIHDPAVFADIQSRLARLTPESRPRWGRMTVDQMLWHVNQGLAAALGHTELEQARAPIPKALMRFLVLNLPWTKNAPTNKAFVARARHDFQTELARCRALLDESAARSIDQAPRPHPMFGRMSGRDQSRLSAKHLDHHLRQFGV